MTKYNMASNARSDTTLDLAVREREGGVGERGVLGDYKEIFLAKGDYYWYEYMYVMLPNVIGN